MDRDEASIAGAALQSVAANAGELSPCTVDGQLVRFHDDAAGVTLGKRRGGDLAPWKMLNSLAVTLTSPALPPAEPRMALALNTGEAFVARTGTVDGSAGRLPR
jgi:hypothetical protein